MRKRFFLLLFFSMSLMVSLPSMAMLPVVDIGAIENLVKNFEQLNKQYDLLQRSYDNAKSQLDQIKQLKQASQGHYGFGGLFNGTQDLANREWSPPNWQSALRGLSGGNPARYRELVAAYQHDHPTLSQSDYQKGASPTQAQGYQQDVAVNRTAMVNATYSFNNIKTHLNTIHALSKKIDEANNTKAAMDLNSRLLAEIAYIQTQELKMQIIFNQQLAQTNVDAIAAKSARAKFNTLPNH